MSDDRKDVPAVNAPNYQERVRETLQTYLGTRGNVLDRGLTLRDLTVAGLITLRPGVSAGGGTRNPVAGPGPGVAPVYEVDLTPPPTPSGFNVGAAISNLFIGHDAPVFTQGHGYARTIVYGATRATGAPAPVFADAVEITQFVGQFHAYPTNPATVWHLWIKYKSVDGVLSVAPAGGTNGLSTTTGQDVSSLVRAMTGPGNPFTILAVDTTIDGRLFPAGTYSTQAFILDAQITNAKIANLAVDNAKIANLNVSKLLAGSISVGEYIQSTNYLANTSGWHINGDGTAEFSGVVVRGTVIATTGQIGGNAIDSTGLQSPGYNAGLSGWRLDSSGVITAYSAAGANQFNLAATGTTPIIKVGAQFYVLGNGSAYFGGTLGANTVTAETIVSESIGKPFAFSSFPQPDDGSVGGGALSNADGMTPLLVIGPRNAVAGYLFGTASVSGAYLVTGHFGTLTTKLLVEEYTGTAGTGTVTVRDALYQTATAADSRVSGVNVYAMPVTVFSFALAADTKSVKITFSVRNNNTAQVAYLSNIAVAGAVLQR